MNGDAIGASGSAGVQGVQGCPIPEWERVLPRPVTSIFGEWLEERLKELELSSERASKLAGLTPRHCTLIRHGYFHPNRDTCDKLAPVLQADAEEMWALVVQSKGQWKHTRRAMGGVFLRSRPGKQRIKISVHFDQETVDSLREISGYTRHRKMRHVSSLVNAIVNAYLAELPARAPASDEGGDN